MYSPAHQHFWQLSQSLCSSVGQIKGTSAMQWASSLSDLKVNKSFQQYIDSLNVLAKVSPNWSIINFIVENNGK